MENLPSRIINHILSFHIIYDNNDRDYYGKDYYSVNPFEYYDNI